MQGVTADTLTKKSEGDVRDIRSPSRASNALLQRISEGLCEKVRDVSAYSNFLKSETRLIAKSVYAKRFERLTQTLKENHRNARSVSMVCY